MTRLELLTIVVGRARTNGFEFRRWYTARLELPWISSEAALTLLDQQRRYYALLFSHEFAKSFWKPGEDITFSVPAKSFQRSAPDGGSMIVERKSFIRRSARRDAWRYHLREMALAEEIIAATTDELQEVSPAPRAARPAKPAKPGRNKPLPRKLPTDTPAFLRRPYEP